MTLVVNLIGGPGTGKSTTAAGVFFELKDAGVNCELVTEYAKDQVWGRTTTTLGNQIYIFGKQYHRLWRLMDQVDVVVTDASIFLSTFYGAEESETFQQLVLETFNSMDNLTVFLERVKPYNPAGRGQDEDEARVIDQQLRELLVTHRVPYATTSADRDAPQVIASWAMEALNG